MKPKLCTVFLCLCLASAAQGWATELPDACGDDKVKFDVNTEKGQPAHAGPAEGEAQVVFIESENHMIGPFMHATVRFGVDGVWAGADSGSSYFATTVDPGVHHLCAGWQSAFGRVRKNVHLASLTAEPGKVYYFAAQITVTGGSKDGTVIFDLSQLNDDEGKYLVKTSTLSTSTAKK
jgi:hypothetical protein